MILCCGEALIDMIPDRTVAGKVAYVPCVGGAILTRLWRWGVSGSGCRCSAECRGTASGKCWRRR